jgi:hypothetical protein
MKKIYLKSLPTLEQFVKEMEQIRFAQTYQENTVLQQRIHEAQKHQQQLLVQYHPLMEKKYIWRIHQRFPHFYSGNPR